MARTLIVLPDRVFDIDRPRHQALVEVTIWCFVNRVELTILDVVEIEK